MEWRWYKVKDMHILAYNYMLISFIFDEEEKKNILAFFKNYSYNDSDDENFTTNYVNLEGMDFIEFGMINRGLLILVLKKHFDELVELMKKEGGEIETS